MNRTRLIAVREFTTNIKRRSFLFTAFGLPLILIAVQFIIGDFEGGGRRWRGGAVHDCINPDCIISRIRIRTNRGIERVF